MTDSSFAILERFRGREKNIDYSLRAAYHDLLNKFGNPQERLPPVFHVAGTNGKGSTCAFLRAMLEAGGYKVHVFTSPHLVSIHERVRLAGELITEEELSSLLLEAEKLAIPHSVTFFEALCAVSFKAFADHPADFLIMEVGLGGRLDATNIVDKKLATLITRLSFDHRDYLGDTLDKIAREKAGIMRKGVPCFTVAQPDPSALRALCEYAKQIQAPLFVAGKDWKVEETKGGFRFADATRSLDLPHPALLGAHQYENAGLSIAALSALPEPLPASAVAQGLRDVEWPARLQRLKDGTLNMLAPEGAEVWLDGGHNDSAGQVLAAQIEQWKREDNKPLYVVLGMLTTKRPREFLEPFAKNIAKLVTVPVPGDPLGYSPDALATEAREAGIASVQSAASVKDALSHLRMENSSRPPRILICGSLYLAGAVLAEQNVIVR